MHVGYNLNVAVNGLHFGSLEFCWCHTGYDLRHNRFLTPLVSAFLGDVHVAIAIDTNDI